MAETTAPEPAERPLGIEAARISLRAAAHCAICDRMVEVAPDGTCPEGHPAELLGGCVDLEEGEECPQLPRFNLAAFAFPPVWGVAHGQWMSVLFIPLWIFVDSAVAVARRGIIPLMGAIVVSLGTLAFQGFFAKRANGIAWRRVAGQMSVDEFARRQRRWALLCVPLGIFAVAWAVYYRLVIA